MGEGRSVYGVLAGGPRCRWDLRVTGVDEFNKESRLLFDKLSNYQLFKEYPVPWSKYEGVSKSFRTGRLERELQMVYLFATRCTVSLFFESV
jgi:hypothetical protein